SAKRPRLAREVRVPRRRNAKPDPEPPPAIGVQPRVVDPHAVFSREEFQAYFRISRATVRNEVREGRLRVSKRAGRYWLLGARILAWLQEGEVVKSRSSERNGFHRPKANTEPN